VLHHYSAHRIQSTHIPAIRWCSVARAASGARRQFYVQLAASEAYTTGNISMAQEEAEANASHGPNLGVKSRAWALHRSRNWRMSWQAA
jgi:hypothetical protein